MIKLIKMNFIFAMYAQKDIAFGEMQRVQNLVRCRFKVSDLVLCLCRNKISVLFCSD